jgi:hypothetical protein
MPVELDYKLNEFEQVDVSAPFDNIPQLLDRLAAHPTMVQPIRAISSETGLPIATFFMSVVTDEVDIFLQLEGFSSKEYERRIMDSFPDNERWSILQPGIFRLKLPE